MKPKYTEDEFYQEIIRIHDLHGYINTVLLKNESKLDINTDYYCSKYHGIQNICNKLGLTFRYNNKIDPDDIMNDFLFVYNKFGKINKQLYTAEGKYSIQAIRDAYGNFNNLMKRCNIKLNTSRMEDERTVLNDISEFVKQYSTTSCSEYRKYGTYSEAVITRLFGNWGNALNKLGLQQIKKEYGKEYILSEVKRVYNKYGFISREIIDNECDFKYQAISYHFTNNELKQLLGTDELFSKDKSINAKILFDILKELFNNDVYDEHYWDWLRNDRTGRIMFVDFYIPSINTVVEYDGLQHYQYIPYLHKSVEAFKDSQYRDYLKEKLLKEHGINIIRFKYCEAITKDNVKCKLGI